MQEAFFFAPAILWEHKAPGVICKWLEVSLDTPNKISTTVWVLQKGRNTSKKQAVIYLFVLNLLQGEYSATWLDSFIPFFLT